jgi:hypothetical protein
VFEHARTHIVLQSHGHSLYLLLHPIYSVSVKACETIFWNSQGQLAADGWILMLAASSARERRQRTFLIGSLLLNKIRTLLQMLGTVSHYAFKISQDADLGISLANLFAEVVCDGSKY